MGELTRQYDWTQTTLGAPHQWPQSLRTTLSIVLNAQFPMLLLWGSERICFYNDAYQSGLVVPSNRLAILGRPGQQVWPDSWATISPLIDQVLSGGGAHERLSMLPSNELIAAYWTASYSPVIDDRGQLNGVLVTCFDNTTAILDQQRLKDSELFTRTLFEHSPVAKAVFVGLDMVIHTANQNMLRMWGKEASVVGQPFMEAMPELLTTLQLERLRKVLTTGETFHQPKEQFELVRYGAPYTGYYEYTYEALRSAAGDIYGVICVASEVTQQVLARRKIEASWALLDTLFQQAPVAMALLEGPDYRLKLANNGLYAMWQLPSGQQSVLNRPVFEAFPSIAGLGLEELLAQVRRTRVAVWGTEQPTLIERSGKLETIYVDFAYSPIVNVGGEVDVMVVVSDVTEQVEARRRLRDSEARYRTLAEQLEQQVRQRTHELGLINAELTEANALLVRSNDNLQQFAYVASHDLQEPLRKIQSFGQLLQGQYSERLGEGADFVERMQSAAARMSLLIQDLLSYSRLAAHRQPGALVDLNQVVGQGLLDLDMLIEETGAEVLVAPLPTVAGEPAQLGQLFHNLISNALKFRRPGIAPHVQLTAQLIAAADLPASVLPSQPVAYYHWIRVTDNGIGFETKYVDRIFQVFQRLHAKNKYPGTGIGLAICEKVVQNHGGTITAQSEPGRGATFCVYLPALDS